MSKGFKELYKLAKLRPMMTKLDSHTNAQMKSQELTLSVYVNN